MFTDSPISFIVKTAFGKAAKLVAGGGKRASRPSGNLILGQIEADKRIREFPAAKKERRRRQTFQIHSRLDPAALATHAHIFLLLSFGNKQHKRTSWPLFKDNLSKTLGRPRMDFIYCGDHRHGLKRMYLMHVNTVALRSKEENSKKQKRSDADEKKKSKKPTRSIREHSIINAARSCVHDNPIVDPHID
jgi:hypothetical protein